MYHFNYKFIYLIINNYKSADISEICNNIFKSNNIFKIFMRCGAIYCAINKPYRRGHNIDSLMFRCSSCDV